MPSGAKKRKAAKKKKESSLDTHVDDSSATSLPSPGSIDKEGSDSGSDIVSPRTPESPDLAATESNEEGKEAFSSGGSTVAVMDASEDGAKAVEAEEGLLAPAQTEVVDDAPPAEDPKVAEAYLTPPDSVSEVPGSNDEGVAIDHVGDIPSAEEPDVAEAYLTPPDSSYEIPLSHDGGVTVEHVEAADSSHAGGTADAGVEPVVLTETPAEVPPDEKVDTTSEPTELSRDVLGKQRGRSAAELAVPVSEEPTAAEPSEHAVPVSEEPAAAETSEHAVPVSEEPAAAEPSEHAVPVSEEPAALDAGYVVVENVEPLSSAEPPSEVKEEGEPITSSACLEQPRASSETQAHTQVSRGVGFEAELPPKAARRTSWWNCCGLCDVFAGNR